MFSNTASNGELITLAVTAAVAIAKRNEAEQLGRLAAFFTILGDTLALLAIQDTGEKKQAAEETYNFQPPTG